ncbi:MAG: DUF938 domain-containing protein [Spirulina sp. SIO3F2]|nr:DUF938 domain-containing protein [Spirulina sp. SIO3F2]
MNNRDRRQFAPATQRNRTAILEVLQTVLPTAGTVLEIASGTGEHAVFFAPQFPDLIWQPTDLRPESLESIKAWQDYQSTPNLKSPFQLDVCQQSWPIENEAIASSINTIVNINMIHIAPWAACEGLMAGAERLLPTGGLLYLYGPFKRQGEHTAPSNAAFDASLRATDPDWGVRDLAAVEAIAVQHQLQLQQVIPMPANNFSVIFINNA